MSFTQRSFGMIFFKCRSRDLDGPILREGAWQVWFVDAVLTMDLAVWLGVSLAQYTEVWSRSHL